MKQRGLSGFRVIDLAGPMGWYGAKILADLGADVVRVEAPGGDPERTRAPFYRDRPGLDRSLAFNFYNTSKQSIIVDFETNAGVGVFGRLVQSADVVLESERYWELEGRGLGYRALSETRPQLIWASITPFGLDGPRAGWTGSDLIAMSAGGVTFLNGYPEDPPLVPPLEQSYNLGGVAAATGILLALQARHKTGQGQLVDVSLQQAVATATENTLGFWDVMGTLRRRTGSIGFQGFEMLFPCLDGWVMGIHGNRWDALLAWAEEAGVVDDAWRDPRWTERSERDANQGQINAFVSQLIAAQTKREVTERAAKYRVALQAVQTVADLITDPQLAHRGFWQAVPHASLGAVLTLPGAPFHSTAGPWRIRHSAPLPGEHSWEVLTGLGISEDEVDRLVREGGVHQWPDIGESRSQEQTTVAAPVRGVIQRLDNRGPLPLEGIRVLDFTQSVTGPLTTRILANHGAEVVKIEWGRRPDGIRLMSVPRPPGNRSPNVSSTFNNFNSGKVDVTLNMNTPGARDIVKQLIGVSDIVIDNYGVDPMPRWGLTFEDVRAIRPDIIMARSSVMGRTGPRAGTVGFGYGIAAVSSWNTLMGFPGRPPLGMGPALPDTTVTCHHLLIGILTALEHRRRTGEGQLIDLSQYESTISWIGPAVMEYLANGRIPPPSGNRHRDYAPHGVFPARGDDQWVALAVDANTWQVFQATLAADGARLDLPEFQTHLGRKEHEDALDATVASWTRQHAAADIAERLQASGVAAYTVSDGRTLVEDVQLEHRQHYVPLDHPEAGTRLYERHAFQLVGTPGVVKRAPLLGEHTDWVLEELLGSDADAVANAYVEGIAE